MQLTGCSGFFFCWVFSVFPPVPGKPLQTVSPVQVSAVVDTDVILPCGLTTSEEPSRVMAVEPSGVMAVEPSRVMAVEPSGVMTVEWSRVDGPSTRTVHVVRGGQELVKEKAPEYHGRTAILEDGSLKLLAVQRRDSGTYRCVLRRESSKEEEVSVSLFVAQVSQVTLSVRRTSDNQLLVQCESSGWSSKPAVSLLDSSRTVLAAKTWSWVQPDHLYSVRAVINAAAAAGSGVVICRVEIPGTGLTNESTVHISDELDPSQGGPRWYLLVVLGVVLVWVLASLVVVFVAPLWMINNLRSSARRLTGWCVALIKPDKQEPEDQPLLGEYGDISRVETTGASDTARANGLLCTGVEASYKLAERDLEKMWEYREMIISVGRSLGVAPALIAAIISRQSQAGTRLGPDGFGQSDPNCFGLMQINKHYHAVKGKPVEKDHVDQGVTFLIQLIKTMSRTKTDWTKEQQLKGALACYISGEDRVIPLPYEELDSVTPYGDFANDVVARAQWFLRHDF